MRKVEKRREDNPGGPDSQGRRGRKKRKVKKHSRIVLMLREVRTQEFNASGEWIERKRRNLTTLEEEVGTDRRTQGTKDRFYLPQ